MDCFHDFCLACDKESTNGLYCSQACKLADLERATASAPSSPTSTSTRTPPSRSGSGSSYVLAPAYKFASKPNNDDMIPRNSYFMWTPAQQAALASDSYDRALSPSSSWTSLSSTSSSPNMDGQGGMSEQAKRELKAYFNSLDRKRISKRRTSTR